MVQVSTCTGNLSSGLPKGFVAVVALVALVAVVALCALVHKKGDFQEMAPIAELVS